MGMSKFMGARNARSEYPGGQSDAYDRNASDGGDFAQQVAEEMPQIDYPINAPDSSMSSGAAPAGGLPGEQIQMIREFLQRTDEMDQLVLDSQERSQIMDQLIHSQIEKKDALIDKLHEELDSYRQDAMSRFEDQLMKEVIRIRTGMQRTMSREGWTEKSADEVRNEFEAVLEDITDLLERQNVEPFHTEPGRPFDRSKHQPRIEMTQDPALDRTVKQSLSDGYVKGDRTLMAERVILYQYEAQKTDRPAGA